MTYKLKLDHTITTIITTITHALHSSSNLNKHRSFSNLINSYSSNCHNNIKINCSNFSNRSKRRSFSN